MRGAPRRRRLPLALLLVAAAAVVAAQGAVLLMGGGGPSAPPVADCPEDDGFDVLCESRRSTAISRREGVDAALADIAARRRALPGVEECHALAHAVGSAAAARDGAAALGGGDATCWSGYSHGAADALAADGGLAALDARAAEVCAAPRGRSPRADAHARCARMAGRALHAAHDGDASAAVAACARMASDWEAARCIAGAAAEHAAGAANPIHPVAPLPAGATPCGAAPAGLVGPCVAAWRTRGAPAPSAGAGAAAQPGLRATAKSFANS